MLPLLILAISLLLSTLIILDGIAFFTFPLLPFKSFLLEIYSIKAVEKSPDLDIVNQRTWLLDQSFPIPTPNSQSLILTSPEEPQFLIFTIFSLYACLFIFGIAILYRHKVLRIADKLVRATPIARNLEGLETDLDFDLLKNHWSRVILSFITGPLIYNAARFVSLNCSVDEQDNITVTKPKVIHEKAIQSPVILGAESKASERLASISNSNPVLMKTITPPNLIIAPKSDGKVLLADVIPEINKDHIVKSSRAEIEEINRSLLFQQQAMFFS